MFWPELSTSLLKMIMGNTTLYHKYVANMDPVDWAEESFQITRQVYQQLPPPPIQLGQAYFEQFFPVVQQRLIAGGIRLARLLNLIFARQN